MVAKSKKPPELPEIDPAEYPEFLTADDVNPALERIYSDMGIEGDGQRANVYVYKEMPDGNDAQIWKGSPDDYALEPLTRKFGSGNYRVKIYVQSERGNMVVKANQIIRVLLDPAEDARIAAARNPQPAAAAPQQFDPATFAAMITQGIAAAMPKPQPAPDPLQMLTGLAGVLRAIMPQPAATPAPAAPQMNPVEMLKLGIDLARDNSGGGDVDPMTRLIEKFAPLFAQTLVAPPAPQAQQPQLPAPNPQQPETPEMLEQAKAKAAAFALKQGLAQLVEKAARNADPELYADFVADNVDDATLAQFLDNPQWFEYLAQFNADILKYREWFTRLRDALAALYELEGDAQDTMAGAGNSTIDGGQNPA